MKTIWKQHAKIFQLEPVTCKTVVQKIGEEMYQRFHLLSGREQSFATLNRILPMKKEDKAHTKPNLGVLLVERVAIWRLLLYIRKIQLQFGIGTLKTKFEF